MLKSWNRVNWKHEWNEVLHKSQWECESTLLPVVARCWKESGNAGIHTLLNYLFEADDHFTKTRYQETEFTHVDDNFISLSQFPLIQHTPIPFPNTLHQMLLDRKKEGSLMNRKLIIFSFSSSSCKKHRMIKKNKIENDNEKELKSKVAHVSDTFLLICYWAFISFSHTLTHDTINFSKKN